MKIALSCEDGSAETGEHLVFRCTGVEGRPANLQGWGDLDRPIWQGEGKERIDQVAVFFGSLYRVLRGRQARVGEGTGGRG